MADCHQIEGGPLNGDRTETLPSVPGLFDPVQPGSKKGKGRTGSSGPHEGDKGRVEAKTQTRMIGTAPMGVTNPVGSTISVGLVQIRPTLIRAQWASRTLCSNSARADSVRMLPSNPHSG